MDGLSKESLRKIYNQMSPFEFKEKLISLATKHLPSQEKLLDAGRGNPNWTATLPREAFFTFGQFAVLETQRTWQCDHLAGMPGRVGIAARLLDYLEAHPHMPGRELLLQILTYGEVELGMDKDTWIHILVDGIIGDNYPYPDRMLRGIEETVANYLLKELCPTMDNASAFEVFATEGGSAGMCYLFDSLLQNHLLQKGDTIALMTPIFTPYLEIPALPQYDFNVVLIGADEVDEEGRTTWQYTAKAIEPLKDPKVKAVFIVNPNNPGSIALSPTSKNYLVDLVKNERKDLMIITDDVYSTFVEQFSSLLEEIPYNTLCVYSLSKYFGVTGWRLGAIMLQKENIFNELIDNLPQDLKAHANHRYHHITTAPEELGFIDRIVADSRQVALNHTAGLSTPQQVQMAFFCIFALCDKDDQYKKLAMSICHKRKQALCDGLGILFTPQALDAAYYTEINLMEWATSYDSDFAAYLEAHFSLLDVLYSLAKDHHTILLRGDAFASSKWGLRISLANLYEEDYYKIGKAIASVFNDLIDSWQKTKDKR
ncbi:MAG: aspartate 4-decarboxylase [Cellulosilyticaceae bacterium]